MRKGRIDDQENKKKNQNPYLSTLYYYISKITSTFLKFTVLPQLKHISKTLITLTILNFYKVCVAFLPCCAAGYNYSCATF